MNRLFSFAATAAAFISCMASSIAAPEPPSEFDETVIRSIQDASQAPQQWPELLAAFEASNDPLVKAAKWEQVITTFDGNILSSVWSEPAGGWKLLEFPTTGNLTVEDVRKQPWRKAEYSKLVAQNETEAVRLRGAGALMLSAASDGHQWGEKLILDIAQRPDSNVKRLTYWYANDFASDWVARGKSLVHWPVNWSAWQQAYNAANSLGKAIILRNITMLAVRRNEVATAAAINLSALSGTDRELKAIALAFGDPSLGPAVTAKWAEIAGNASDAQLQALAQEVRTKFGITD